MLRITMFAAFFVMGSLAPCVRAETHELALGRSIFEHGIGRDGREVGGRIHGNVLLRGRAVACTSCHGQDARGGEEAFVRVPDIRWTTLSKPFAPRRIGESRPAYNQVTFARAIHHGIAASDATLDPTMPRFDLSQDETEALIDHLRSIGSVFDRSSSQKMVLALVPTSPTAQWVRELGNRLNSCPPTQTVAAFPPLEIIFYDDPSDALVKLKAQIATDRVSDILAPYIAGWEPQYFDAAREWVIHTLLPVTPLDSPADSNVNFSLPGLGSQIGALLDRGVGGLTKIVTVIRSENGPLSQELLNFVRSESKKGNIRLNEVILERSDSIDTSAVWLVLAPLDKVAKKLRDLKRRTSLTVLVPVMFFDPVAAQYIERQFPRTKWQIAYPYPPIHSKSGRWRSPLDVWAEAGCALMTMIADEKQSGTVPSRSSITLESGLTLLHTKSDMSHRGQVIVEQWEEPKRSQK